MKDFGLSRKDLRGLSKKSLKFSIPRGILLTKKDYNKAIGIKAREQIPAKIKHEVENRAKGKCEWKGCKETKYLDFHHKDMINYNNKPSNIMYVCPTHHRAMHDKYKKVITKRDAFGIASESKVMSKEALKKYKEEKKKQSNNYFGVNLKEFGLSWAP